MLFGLCTISNKEWPVERVIDAAAVAGYDGVEVWGGDHVNGGSEETCRFIRNRAEAADLEIPVYGSYLRPGTTEFTDELSHELRIADRLGADLVRVWAGEQEWQERDDDHFEAVVSDLREATAAATDRDLTITVEKHEGTLTNTTEGARRVVEAVEHPQCGLNYQPLFDMAPDAIEREARRLAPISNNVHLQAVPERGGRDRCPLSEAFYDVGAVVQSFDVARFSGYVNVEFVTNDPPYKDAVTRDHSYLTDVF